MATGVFILGQESAALLGLSSSVQPIAMPTGDRGLYDPAPNLDVGVFDENRPVSKLIASFAGAKVSSYFDDFYNRIYFTPSLINFGPIGSDVSTNVLVWNAYVDQSVTLSDIDYPNDQGLTVTGPATPVEFKPLGTKTYTVAASAQGPAALRAEIDWSFNLPWMYAMPVSGDRLKVWTFEPNWKSAPFAITYSFSTEIFTSRSGKEQRRALRTTPRKTVEFTATMHHKEFQDAKRRFWSWQDKSFAMPEFTRFAEVTAPMGAGEDTISVSTVLADFRVGAIVLLVSGSTIEIRTVKAIDAALKALTFDSVSETVWPLGARVHVALTGSMVTSLGFARMTNAVAELPLVFDVTPLSTPYIEPPAPTDTFNGREVFLKKPNWAERVDVTIEHDVDDVDYGRGAIVRFVPVAFGREIKKATFLGKGFDQAEDIRNLFFRMRGRRGEFYMPSWEDDIPAILPTSAGASFLRVPGYEFYDQFVDSTVHKAVSVQMADGTYQLRKVTSIDKVSDAQGEGTLISIDSPWGAALTETSVVMVSWLYVRRFASDDLTIEWMTRGVAQAQLAMQTLEDLDAETAPS